MINNYNVNAKLDEATFKKLDDYARLKKYKNHSHATADLLRMALEYIKEKQEEAEDEYLLAFALEREKNGTGITYSAEEVYKELGISADELDEIPMEYGVDFE
jgi:predicted DNA-binding protein